MALETEFVPLTIEELPERAGALKAQGWRFVQVLAVNTEDGIDLVYSFMKDGRLANHEIKGVKKDVAVPSITDKFLAAFVFENEVHDLFGVSIEGIAIDFGGNFYALAQKEPMTIISPEQKAAREKARKAAAAKAAKEKAAQAAAAGAAAPAQPASGAVLKEKLAGMDPEKAARVAAAKDARGACGAAAARKGGGWHGEGDRHPVRPAAPGAAGAFAPRPRGGGRGRSRGNPADRLRSPRA